MSHHKLDTLYLMRLLVAIVRCGSFARGASPRERASLVENLDALRALLEGGPPVLGERLRRIRDAI